MDVDDSWYQLSSWFTFYTPKEGHVPRKFWVPSALLLHLIFCKHRVVHWLPVSASVSDLEYLGFRLAQEKHLLLHF